MFAKMARHSLGERLRNARYLLEAKACEIYTEVPAR